MRGFFPKTSKTVMAALMVAGMTVTSLGITASPAVAKKKDSGPSYSKELVAAAAPIEAEAKRLMELKEKGTAKEELTSAVNAIKPQALALEQQFSAGSNDDKLGAGNVLLTLGNVDGDSDLQKRGLALMVASGLVAPDRQPMFNFFLGRAAYVTKDYAAAAPALKAAVEGGYQDDLIGALAVDAYGKSGNVPEGVAVFRQAVAARKAAGSPVPVSWFDQATIVADAAHAGPQALDVASLYVRELPSSRSWLAAVQVAIKYGGFDVPATLDVLRLADRSGALAANAGQAAPYYKEYIESADPRRSPGEVVAVIDRAVAVGALSSSDQWVAEARRNASGRIAADKASLPGEVSGAMAAGGTRAQGLADAFLGYGDAAQAEALYKAALASGGGDANLTLTRLGIAQFDQGKYAEAQETFGKVTGTRKPIGDLWQALAANKARGSAN